MIKILTEGSSKFGFGHLVRCASIYNYCKRNCYQAEFIIDGDDTSLEFIENNNASMVNWKNNDYLSKIIDKEDIVFIDSYYVTLEQINIIKEKAIKCVIIDDHNRLDYSECIIVNPNFCAELLNFNNKNIYLVGQDYILLRNEFLNKQKTNINKEVNNILITLGGSDILNLTPQLIRYLKENFMKAKIDVVVGFGYQNIKEIENEVVNNVVLHNVVDAHKMANLILKSDFVISAAGQTLNEILKLKTPACFIKVIENQQINIDYINKTKQATCFDENDLDNIKKMNSFKLRKEIFNKMSEIKNEDSGASNIFKYLIKEGILNV